ncbi:MAG TPA: TerC family protein [Polyangiaceae bacterium]|nr:TerC family protein [Polyangiaceae bacterium]
MHVDATPLDWAVFAAVVIGALTFDRLVFGAKEHISFREAAIRSSFFVLVGTLFSLYVMYTANGDAAITYLVAYLVEESLSVDNLFVFLVLFTYFRISEGRQQRILFWGILGAVVMRGIFIVAGSALLAKFHWMTYVFGGFLLITGAKLLVRKEESVDPEGNLALRLGRRYLRTTEEFHGDHFFVRKNGTTYATPLFLVLVVVEFTDVLFAVDSVPAVLAISSDVFIVYTSNVMAILGLRALFFVLSGMMGRFHHLGTGLAVILLFIGAKMSLTAFLKIPPLVSLAVIASVLAVSILASLLRPARAPTPPDGSTS